MVSKSDERMIGLKKKIENRTLRIIFCWAVTTALLGLGAVLSMLLLLVDNTGGFVNMIFVLMVLLIARFTDGYIYGIVASFISVFFVNFAFTYPYWKLDFTIAGYPLTFLTMLTVSLVVSALTFRVKHQEQVRMEAEREAMRANLLRAVSHDIRTPLTSIVGSTSAILENNDVLTDEQKISLLKSTRDEAQWLIQMVENLLSITRFGADSQLSTQLEAAEELLSSVSVKFQKRFPEVKLSLSAPEDPIFIPMDATLIEQVTLNLLENAVSHGHSTHIRLFVERRGQLARFTVQDNGSGIAPELLPSIFSPTAVSKRTDGDRRRNMGIGLSVCHSIVKAHGGTMSAENTAQGAAFHFSLPLQDIDLEETIYEDQG